MIKLNQQRGAHTTLHDHRQLAFLLICAALMLTAVGIIEIYAASATRSMAQFNDPYLFLRKHVLVTALCVPLVFLLLTLPLKYLAWATLPLFLLTLVALSLLFVPALAIKAGLATRWLSIFGFNFQPAELARLAIIFYLARNLSRPTCNLQQARYLWQSLLPPALICTLIMLQPDFGTAFLLVTTCCAMLFVAGLSRRYLVLCGGALAVFVATAISIAPYRFKRLASFLDPWAQVSDGGFQIIQSYLAFQNGGVLGAGLGESKQKLFFLPEAHTDFILSVIGEELGLVGVLFVWSLFFYICYLGFKIAALVKDQFHKFLAFGISFLITSQALLNMGVVTGLLPTKGLPLPFISSGSSALLVFFIAIGILARLAKTIEPDPVVGEKLERYS